MGWYLQVNPLQQCKGNNEYSPGGNPGGSDLVPRTKLTFDPINAEGVHGANGCASNDQSWHLGSQMRGGISCFKLAARGGSRRSGRVEKKKKRPKEGKKQKGGAATQERPEQQARWPAGHNRKPTGDKGPSEREIGLSKTSEANYTKAEM